VVGNLALVNQPKENNQSQQEEVMKKITRRDAVKTGTALAASAALGGGSLLTWAQAWAAEMPFTPEPGATLRALRWNRFVESEDIQFDKNVAAFEKVTGVKVRLDKEWLDDIQPKASVAANIGSGPDLVWGLLALPHLFPDKLLDVTDVADYLGGKYGGWYPVAEEYGKRGERWICIPLCTGGNYPNYRVSWMKEAGFDSFPATTDEFLKYSAAMKKIGHPGGMALGHATGDGNAWTHWLVWTFGGRLVDEDNKVAINSPETVAALEYGRELYNTWILGTASWLDGHNNKAFLSGQIGYTNNGISIYAKAVRDSMDIRNDMDHAFFPVGPGGQPTELQPAFPLLAFNYTKYPNACKAFMSFLMEAPQYNAWLQESVGYFTQVLRAYDKHPVWAEDAKRAPFREASARALSVGHAGDLGFAAAQALADFIIVDMVAEAATGASTGKKAAAKAEKRANRYYRV
jgi:multiple sugar transport system substrate-binding protein